jgi:hypothetical protein
MRRLVLFALLTLVSGCVAQARSPLVHEPLDVPPVPPRVIVPEIEEVEPPMVDAARPAPQRTDAASKPADKPADPPKPPVTEPARTEETPRVRTPQMANDEQADLHVRSVLARAQGMLDKVPYGPLSNAAKQQYDTAKRFIAQADRALKIRNYVFARNLADKAETLARQLGK